MSSPRLNHNEGEPDFDRYDADEKAYEDSEEEKRLFKRDEPEEEKPLNKNNNELLS